MSSQKHKSTQKTTADWRGKPDRLKKKNNNNNKNKYKKKNNNGKKKKTKKDEQEEEEKYKGEKAEEDAGGLWPEALCSPCQAARFRVGH